MFTSFPKAGARVQTQPGTRGSDRIAQVALDVEHVTWTNRGTMLLIQRSKTAVQDIDR